MRPGTGGGQESPLEPPRELPLGLHGCPHLSGPGLLTGTRTGMVLGAVGRRCQERPDGTQPADPQLRALTLREDGLPARVRHVPSLAEVSRPSARLGPTWPLCCAARSPCPASLSSNQCRWARRAPPRPSPLRPASLVPCLPPGPRGASSPPALCGVPCSSQHFPNPIGHWDE